MTATAPIDDEYLPLALALHSNPGAYAVLAGAGVSMGAGIPTAWQIVVDLINTIARNRDPNAGQLNDQTAGPWYEKQFGLEATYSRVIEHLGGTTHERAALLRKYIESSTITPGAKPEPSTAHRSVAKLMEMGVIRVVVTMNFDRLFEAALNELHIQPTIVATDADARGLAPLHTIKHCIIHLHGDYLNAASMRNTDQELKGYSAGMRKLLKEVLMDYGLIVAGWSAISDHKLRELFVANHRHFYTLGWINPSDPDTKAKDLITRYKARKEFKTTADDALFRLRDIVETIEEQHTLHPLNATVAASRIKRDISGQRPAIAAHDMLTTTVADLRSLEALQAYMATGDRPKEMARYQKAASQVAERAKVAATCCATLAYWGDDNTEAWWLSEIDWFSHELPSAGLIHYNEFGGLRRIAGWLLFHAGGIAAVASGHIERALRILQHQRAATAAGSSDAVRRIFVDTDTQSFYRGHRSLITSLVGSALGLSTERIDDAWQLFDLLHLALDLSEHPKFASLLEDCLPGDLEQSNGPDLLNMRDRNHMLFFPHILCVERIAQPPTTTIHRWTTPAAENIDPQHLTLTTPDMKAIAEEFNLNGMNLGVAIAAAAIYACEVADQTASKRPSLNRLWLDHQVAPT